MINLWYYLLGINLLTFFLYWQDKRAARRQGWRVSEYLLLLCGFLGGSLAALIAQQVLRHKTKKRSFQFKFWALVVVQVALVLFPPAMLKLGFARLFA
jgi:uncharacterized membrane protein YsdA (DUF1294 family)